MAFDGVLEAVFVSVSGKIFQCEKALNFLCVDRGGRKQVEQAFLGLLAIGAKEHVRHLVPDPAAETADAVAVAGALDGRDIAGADRREVQRLGASGTDCGH
ncbi:hypothetical protein D3C78_1786030 [compost metagenome]